METAVFAAGCFWGVESAFAELPGVLETEVGYTGGDFDKATYQDVCAGVTGHAEAVKVVFDPAKISYAALTEKFFELHDPTQLNRQGPDVGDQYRSGIFTTTPEQSAIAHEIKERVQKSGRFKKPVVTIIEPLGPFWRAEDYHQKYFDKRGGGSCHI